MQKKIKSIQRVINNTSMLFVFILILITTFLIWNGIKQYYDFVGYNKVLSFNSTNNVANEINQYLLDKNRLVSLFVNDNLSLIKNISDTVDDESESYKKLEENVTRYFPGNFTFTITNLLGESIFTDFEGRIGDICIADLKDYLSHDILLTRVHPNNVAYHFDVIARWTVGDKSGLFFVSFLPENLGRIINLSQIPKHNILVINPRQSNLIEITKDGARINWDRDDYRLTDSELKYKLAQIEIPNTVWQVIDLVDDDLFSDFLYKIIFQSGVIFLLVLIIGILIIIMLKNSLMVLLTEEKLKS